MALDDWSIERNQDRKSSQSRGKNHGGKLFTGLLLGSHPASCLYYTPHSTRGGTAHSGLGIPPSISNQENALPPCPQVAIPQLRFLLPRCVKLTIENRLRSKVYEFHHVVLIMNWHGDYPNRMNNLLTECLFLNLWCHKPDAILSAGKNVRCVWRLH